METEKEWNAKILALTLDIQKRHPELSKYLDEMPVTIPNKSNTMITIRILREYYESLLNVEKHYQTSIG